MALFPTGSELLAPAESEFAAELAHVSPDKAADAAQHRRAGIRTHGRCSTSERQALEGDRDGAKTGPGQEEDVGQRHGSAPAFAATKSDMSQEEARRFAASSAAEATTPERIAESIGERVGDAYSDPGSVARYS